MRKQTPEIDKEIGAKFRRLRKQARLTQDQLGERFGVTAQQISKYERGASPILVSDFQQLQWLAEVASEMPLPSQAYGRYGEFAENDSLVRLIDTLERVFADIKISLALARRI